ncbi:hypothetical protein SISNIDRAFT_158607 [Sistotremastrum niveocremeum HHB9708]|uniref:Uncharacterized protein n=1 Tax=Sistotremastrum niveocremeum HHB9708 TaxID=1314777 RepID=A0A164SS44_9AGAM|nr:hypothetical protein SISNIDRAFT_158607 [Sistotremastrum niveocremeum HHB9708]
MQDAVCCRPHVSSHGIRVREPSGLTKRWTHTFLVQPRVGLGQLFFVIEGTLTVDLHSILWVNFFHAGAIGRNEYKYPISRRRLFLSHQPVPTEHDLSSCLKEERPSLKSCLLEVRIAHLSPPVVPMLIHSPFTQVPTLQPTVYANRHRCLCSSIRSHYRTTMQELSSLIPIKHSAKAKRGLGVSLHKRSTNSRMSSALTSPIKRYDELVGEPI